jgi:hypothetical protein
VGGYGTDQELIQLEAEGVAYHPDLVILHFCLFSDFIDNTLSASLWDARQPKPFFTWDGRSLVKHDEHVRLSAFGRLAQWAADNSHVYNRIRERLHLRYAPRERGRARARSSELRRHPDSTVDLTFRMIRRMNEVAVASGARFFVVLHPGRDDFPNPSRFVTAFCGAPLLKGIQVVEMGERYRAAGLGYDLFALDSAGHLTPVGHEIVAETLSPLIAEPITPAWDFSSTCRSSPPDSAGSSTARAGPGPSRPLEGARDPCLQTAPTGGL